MAKKQKHPEHENLERWMVSYADFVTLLFATFVVLYALAQVDAKDFEALEQSLKQAFAAPSIMQGSEGVMEGSSNALFDSSQADSMIAPLMMEYMNAKYEEQSMNDIQKDVEAAEKTGELDGVEVEKSDRGLVIRFKDDCLFAPSSAVLQGKAKVQIDIVGRMVIKRFILHNIRVEGHTDNLPIFSAEYPSNWELSSARASSVTRYLIERFKIMPSLFTVVGFADTRPLVSNTSEAARSKNRRVEILILKNRFKGSETSFNAIAKMSKAEQEALQKERQNTINRIGDISEAAKKLTAGNIQAEKNAIILNKVYTKEVQRLSRETNAMSANDKKKITGEGDWLRPRTHGDIRSNIKPF